MYVANLPHDRVRQLSNLQNEIRRRNPQLVAQNPDERLERQQLRRRRRCPRRVRRSVAFDASSSGGCVVVGRGRNDDVTPAAATSDVDVIDDVDVAFQAREFDFYEIRVDLIRHANFQHEYPGVEPGVRRVRLAGMVVKMRRQMLLLVVLKMRQMLLLLLLFIILWPIRGMMMVVDVRSVPDGLLMDVNVVIGIVATVVGNAANVIVVVVFRSESWRFLFAGVGKRRMLDVIRDKCLLVTCPVRSPQLSR